MAFNVVAVSPVVLRRQQPELPRGFHCLWAPVVFLLWLVSQLDWVTWLDDRRTAGVRVRQPTASVMADKSVADLG